jgi:HTH-type transcriptional regulator/antitoxin PezA
MIKNYISANIKFLYKKTTFSQDDFGNLFEVGKGLISNYINGRALPKIEVIQKICAHYKISIDSFVNTDLSKEQKENTALSEPQENYQSQPPTGFTLISVKHLELLESTIEDKNKIIKSLEERLGEGDKSKTA